VRRISTTLFQDEPTSSYRKILGLALPVGLETVFQTSDHHGGSRAQYSPCLFLSTWGQPIILIAASVQPAKVLNNILGNGILPSGGDTKFVLVGHLVGSYLVGLPVAVLLGLFAGLNAWGVFGARALEEIIKIITFLLRFRTPAWHRKSL